MSRIKGAVALGCAVAAALAGAPAAGAVELAPGQILVTEEGSAVDGSIVMVDPASGQQTLVSDNAISTDGLLGDPAGIALDAAGQIYVIDQENAVLVRVDPATGQQTLVSDNTVSGPDHFDAPMDLALAADGSAIVVDGKSDALIRVDLATGEQALISGNSAVDLLEDPQSLAVDGPGLAYVLDPSAGSNDDGAVVRIDLATGAQTLLSDNALSPPGLFSGPVAIAREASGRLLISDNVVGAQLIAVTPPAAAQSALSPGATLPVLVNPGGIAVDADGTAVVVERHNALATGGLVRVDPATGSQTLITDDTVADADLLDAPIDAAIVPAEPPLCLGVPATITGDDGANALTGTAGRDVIHAGGGKDRVKALGGNDLVCGGKGGDTVKGGAGKDALAGQAGRDRLNGGGGRDRLKGGPGKDRLKGGGGRDSLRGGPGKDVERQ